MVYRPFVALLFFINQTSTLARILYFHSRFYLGKNSFNQSSFYLSNNYFSSIQLLFKQESFYQYHFH